MAESDLRHSDITRAIIGAFFTVYNRLGDGFLEARYAAALERELTNAGRHVAREYATRVYYEGEEIGFHRLDMVVDLLVVVEIKSAPVLLPYARRQLHNYLRASNLEVGLLLHFGPKPHYERLFVPNQPRNKPSAPVIPPPWDAQAIDNAIELERFLEEHAIEEGWKAADGDSGDPGFLGENGFPGDDHPDDDPPVGAPS